MRRKEKNSGEQTKAPKRRWGVGKTLSVIFASVAFIVGIAILGVYLAGGFTERTTIPQDISFNAQNDPNFNSDLNRLEITSSSFELTIGSTTENVTSDVVTLGFSYTYAYNFDTQSFTDVGWGITNTGDGYLENGVLRIPRQVRIGVPFTVEVLTYDYTYTDSDGTQEIIDQIRGGISTITATSQNPDLTPISLTIAVDSPVYKTEVVLLDAHGFEITPNGDISEVVEEERFDVITKFYPAESRYIYADTGREKTSFYQLSNVSSEVVNVVYDSSTSLHFEAGRSAEGGTITAFTAVNAKVQEQVEADVLAMELTDNESIYNAYLQHYGNLARDQVLTDEANFNVVQANVDELIVGSAGQPFDIHDQADLRIFLGDSAELPDRFLGVQVRAQNGNALNNILANVALSFSLSGQDPTIASGEGSPILTVKGGDGQALTPTALDGVNYYFPFINEGVTDYNNAFWDLRVLSGYKDRSITVTVSLLLGNAEDGYQLFDGQAEFTLEVIEHVENDVSWAEGTDLTQELLLTYDEGSTNPDPTPFLLAGLTDIPTDNIFKTVAYFVAFDDSLLGEGDDSAKTEAAITLAQQIFDGLVDGSRAGVYQTATGNRILVPLAITGDTLTVQEVGQFDLYFATVNGTAESGLYNIVRMVGTPISITVTKTLYVNSVSGAQVLFDSAVLEGGFAEVTENTFIPTISDNTEKDQIQFVFTIASDSVDVFEEEFQNGRISLIIYSGQNQINSNFTISNGQITVSEEDQTATLAYTLTANSSFTVANDTPITAIALAYSGNGSVKPINWSFSEIYTSGSLSLYTPAPAKEDGVVLNMDGLDTDYNVEQALGEDGKFTTTITPGNLNLNDLISNISNNITITDQHGRVDTLQNSWTFTSNSSVLRIGQSDGIAGQGFAFSGVGSAALGVVCRGVNAANTIEFDVSAQGITKIEYDANGEETANHDPTKNLDTKLDDAGADYSITSITEESGELASVQKITVTKYGMSGATFNLSDLVRFYVGDDGATQYTNISFRLSSIYFGTANLEDAFGQNGMIFINGATQGIDNVSEATLQNINITSLTLNHNFGEDHKITFLVSDTSGAVNYTFELNILNNTSVSAPSTVETGTNGGALYANVKRENINAIVTYTYPRETDDGKTFSTNLLTQGFIVPNEKDGNYIVSATNENAVGEIDAVGNVTFYHFFRDATKEFAVCFYPEGVNSYALDATINFKVTRNVEIVQVPNQPNSIDAFATNPEDITKYFTIKQISDDKKIVGVDVNYYIGTGGDNYLVADASGNLLNSQVQVAQNLTFDYGITSLVQEIIITITSGSDVNTETGTSSDIFQQTVTLNVVLPEDDFWSDLAGDLTVQDSTATPSWQFTGGTNKLNYLVVESGQTYKIESYQYGEADPTKYTISISQRDGDNRLSYYSVIEDSILYTAPSNDLLYGYGEEEKVYTYMTLTQGNKRVVLRVPTIISQIGTKFVSYPSQENEEDGSLSYIYDENSLDLSKQTWSQLYADGGKNAKYNTVTAGSKIDLNDFINLPANANFNITTSQSFTVGGSAGKYVQNAIGDLIYQPDSNGTLTLNHLSSTITEAYLFIEYTISTASGSESFGYLFKVEPSVVLDEPNYPYGGAAEYITMSGSQTRFDLDETFDSTTVQNGHSRFEYTFDPEIEDAEDLLYTDQVVSVKVGTQTYTDPSNWAGFINARISASSSTRDHSFLVLSSLNTAEVVEIVVRRTYGGTGYSNGQLSAGKSIVGGTIDYHFVLNDNRNYTIRVEIKNNIQNGVTDYTWDINNWASSSSSATENADAATPAEKSRTETRTFYLVENWSSGSATSGNIIENRLYFNLHDQSDWALKKNDDNSFEATSGDLRFTFAYSNSGLNNGTFTVTYPEYLSQDYSFSATLYTDHGALSEVTFVFHADANASLIDDNSTFDGGQDVSIGSIFEIYTSDGNDQPIGIDSVTINSYKNGEEDLSGFVNANGTTIQLASIVGNDIVGDLTLTVSWSNRSYTFTIPNFTITANIEQEQSLVFDNQIGGTSLSITADDLLKNVEADGTFLNNNSTITLTANPSNSAIDNGNSTLTGESLNIKFNQVGAVTEVPMSVTITVKSDFGDITTTITIEVTFRIYPSVRTYVSYPNPTGNKELEVEYIENGTTFADFGENFLDSSAIFADNARINVEYAQVVGGEVVYNSVDSVVITKQDGFNYFTVQTSSAANGSLSDYTGSITVNGKTLNYIADSGYDITDIPTGTEIRLTSLSFSGSINKFAVTYNGQTTTAISKSDASTILPDTNKRVTISSITNAVVTDVATDTTLRTNSQVDLDRTIMFTRGTGGGVSRVVLSISYNSYVISYVVEIVDTAFVLTVNQASNNISSDSGGQYETLYVDKTDSSDLLAKNRMLRATLSSSATAGDYYIFFVENGTTNVLASKIINLSENFVNNSRDSTIYIDIGNNGLSSVVLGSESGQYTPVMILDAVYERVLSQTNDKDEALVYIAENYNNPNATITLTNYFDSTFTNASLSSRVTMTYGGHEVAYNKFSRALKYHATAEDEGQDLETQLNIQANIGTSTTAITKFSFSYSNSGAQWEEYTSDIPAINPTYTYDNNTRSYTLTGTAGTKISISTNDLTDGEYHRVIYNNSYYYSNTDGQIAFTVVEDVNTFRVEKFVKKTASDVYSIAKEFQVSYRYLADLDIVVGAVSDNGGSVTLQANQTINLVKEFNVRRKTTGEKIQMSDMVSGNANFILTTEGNTNEVGNGARYLGISAVRTDEANEDDRTTYDWIITGNGASNNGNDVSLSLKYKIGDFTKTFNLTVHVVNDYDITFDGSGDLNYEGSDGNIPSNQSPYRIDTSAAIFENGSAQILLAGESTTINGGSVASTPYMSITHRNASGQGERSVLDFSYTITTNQISGDTTYNIPNNISAKLNMTSNKWDESTTDGTTTYTWNKDTARSLVMSVKQVVFGSQYYRIELVDKYDYTIYLYFTLDSGEDDPEIYTTSGDSSLSLTEGDTVAFGAQYQRLSVTANDGEVNTADGGTSDNMLTITSNWVDPTISDTDADTVSQIINIRNIDAWGFNQNYYSANSTDWNPEGGNIAYFGGTNLTATDDGYKIGANNLVGQFTNSGNNYYFRLNDTASQEYLKLPNFRFVTIDNITYYYNNGGSLIEVGTSSYANDARYLATESGLYHANNIPGNENSIYKSANKVSLTLPSVGSNYTWIYGNANQASLTMVVRLKYAEESYICKQENAEYSIGSLHGGDSITIGSDMLPNSPESFTIEYNTKSYSSTDGSVTFNKVAGVSEFTVKIPNSENTTATYTYEIVNNTEYFDISQDITLSKTTQVSPQNNLVADNVKFDLKDYINVTAGGSDEQNYTIYDDTLAVAIAPNSQSRFDLIYGGERVSYSLNNANYGWERLYYRSLSERFNTVLTGGTVTIIPKDENATFYYGIRTDINTTGNKPLRSANNTSFVKVANVDYFTVETYDGSDWSTYTTNIGNLFTYDADAQGYSIESRPAGDTITITAADLSNPENYRISYNNTSYYPAQTLTITTITQDRITIANKNDMSSGTVGVDQYYVIQRNQSEQTIYSPYRYRASFTVTGTYQSVFAPNTVRTLPINPNGESPVPVDIDQWAQGVNYTQVGASYQLSFTKAESVNTFTVSPTGTGSYGVSVNGSPVTASGDSYTIPSSINTGETVNVTFTNVSSTISEFEITYNEATYINAYRATLVENSLAEYSNGSGDNNLYFVITSGSSGTGGTGLATIDSATGAISILPNFTADHFVTVQIYQKVSGIDGTFGATAISDMYLLAELRIYPSSTTQISGGG